MKEDMGRGKGRKGKKKKMGRGGKNEEERG